MTTAVMKLDRKAEFPGLYRAGARPAFVHVPPMPFLMIDGHGAPESSGFAEAVQALYATAYGVKFRLRDQVGVDAVVMPLEGLWWNAHGPEPVPSDRASWSWTLMIAQPEQVTDAMVHDVVMSLINRKRVPEGRTIRPERFDEGEAAQILHTGPYGAETAAIERLLGFIADEGRTPRGKHHEIYLSNPDRTDPARLRTIIRHPVT